MATGCNQRTPAEASQPAPAPGMPLPGAFGGQDPGSLISAATMPTLDRRLSGASSVAARITYLSTSGIDGSRQEVSGTVFAPVGTPPDGGWPVIAYGHAAAGIRSECAPSLDPMLLGLSNTVTGLVKAGFVVTVSDYQGLGLDRTPSSLSRCHDRGLQPDRLGSGRSQADSQRLRSMVGIRWLARRPGGVGRQRAGRPVRSGPARHRLGELFRAAGHRWFRGCGRRRNTRPWTNDSRCCRSWLSLAAESPDFRLDDYRRGFASENWDVLLACKGAAVAERDELANQLSNDDLKPANPTSRRCPQIPPPGDVPSAPPGNGSDLDHLRRTGPTCPADVDRPGAGRRMPQGRRHSNRAATGQGSCRRRRRSSVPVDQQSVCRRSALATTALNSSGRPNRLRRPRRTGVTASVAPPTAHRKPIGDDAISIRR